LHAAELAALGRAYLRDQLAAAEAQGILAQAWLPHAGGVSGVVDAVDRVAPHLVLLNASARRSRWLPWTDAGHLSRCAARIDVPVAAVEADGRVRILGLGTGSDEARSRLKFLADVPLRAVRGTFQRFDSRVQLDPTSSSGGSVEAVIDARSIRTGQAARDLHLRSRAFLDADRSPYLVFHSTSIVRAGETITIHGDLSIRDRARPVTLWGAVHELAGWPDGRRRVRVRAGTEIHWREWGIAGVPLVSDRLAIALDILGTEVRAGSGRFNARSMTPAQRTATLPAARRPAGARLA
jgi:polyisoprenoid-binding protein YceI